LLSLRDARSANPYAFFIDSQQRVSEVLERDLGGSIRRGKGPLRLKANPLHRKPERTMQAFS